jgi:hypothetical protein
VICQTIGTEQEQVAGFNRKWSFDVDLDVRVRPEAAGDHIARVKEFYILWRCSTQPNHFPLETMVKCQLLNMAAADSVDTTIANMANQGTSFGETEDTARRSHSFEFTVLPPSVIDGFVCRNDGFSHATFYGCGVVVLEVGMRECVDCDATGQISNCVSAHPISHDKQVATAAPLLCIVAHSNLQRILIHGAPHPFVRARGVLNGWG